MDRLGVKNGEIRSKEEEQKEKSASASQQVLYKRLILAEDRLHLFSQDGFYRFIIATLRTHRPSG